MVYHDKLDASGDEALSCLFGQDDFFIIPQRTRYMILYTELDYRLTLELVSNMNTFTSSSYLIRIVLS